MSPIISYVATAAYLANDRVDEAVVEGQRTTPARPKLLLSGFDSSRRLSRERELCRSDRAVHQSPGGDPSPEQRPRHHLRAHGPQDRRAKYPCSAFASKREALRLGTFDRRGCRRVWRQRGSFPLARARLCGALGNTTMDRIFSRISPASFRWSFLPPTAPNRHFAVLNPGDHRNNSSSVIPDPNARSHRSLKVGVKPRPGTQNGHARIIVSFYDRTKDNKMKPTDARTSYSWLNASADWTDATPKFLVATYVRPKTQSRSARRTPVWGIHCPSVF